MRSNQWIFSAACFLLAGTGLAAAQRPADVVKWSLTRVKSPSTGLALSLSATIQPGWHVYALSQPAGGPTPLKISAPQGSGYEIAKPVQEFAPTRHFDQNFNMETLFYLNSATFRVDLRKVSGAATETIPLDVRFQACNDRLCLPPYTTHLTAPDTRK